MATSMTDQYLANNEKYASGATMHTPAYPGKQPIQPAKRIAIVACMDARLDVEDLLGLQTGDAHIIRNAGGVVTEDAIRCLIISHHLLNTNEIMLIHHTRCGMLAFTDDLLKAGLEGNPAAEKLLGQLIPKLRYYDLVLNEAKCRIIPKSQLHSEEPDLQKLFDDAVNEIRDQMNDEDFDADYGFQSEWEEDDEDEGDEEGEDDLDLKATKLLFNSVGKYVGQEENIERFCLPLFAKAESDYALQHVFHDDLRPSHVVLPIIPR